MDAREELAALRRMAQLEARASAMAPVDPTDGMSGFQKFAAGAGKAMYDVGRGAAQLVGMGPSAAEVDEQKKLDAPLMKTGAGLAGNVAGGIATTLPTMLIPGVNTYTGAAAVGSALGALQPVGEKDSRLLNAGVGAAAGTAGQALGSALGRIARPVQSTLNPEEQRLAQVALREGIPLDAAAQTGSKPLQTANAVFENLPFTAGPQAAQNNAKNAAFTAAALKRAGIAGDSATPTVLATQKRALGQTFEDIAGRNVLDFNQGLGYDLGQVADVASRRLTGDKAAALRTTIDDLLAEAPGGLMDGAKYQAWRGELGRLSRGTDSEAHFFGQAKKALDAAFNAQISGADAAAWKQASREYGNLKTLLQTMGGAGNAANTGNVAPAQLAAALAQQVGKEGKALGRGDLNDLVRVGQRFVRDQVPNSGTAQRQFMQSLMTGGLGAVGGAGAGIAQGKSPWESAGYGAAGMAGMLGGPRLAQMLMQNAPVQGYMINQAASPNAAALAKLLQNSGRSLGAAVPLALD